MKRFQLPFIYSLFAISLILTIISITFRTDANQTWHSQLYPPNWTPGYAIPATSLPQYADRTDLAGDQLFLHDFSYAGYHFGEDEVPTVDLSLGENNPLGKTYNVVDRFGADNTGATDTTEAIQRAIDQAVLDGGGIVYLPAGTYKLITRPDKPYALWIHGSGVILKGDGPGQTKLFWSSDDRPLETLNNKVMIFVSPYVDKRLTRPWWNNPVENSVETKIIREELTPTKTLQLETLDDLNLAVGNWVVVKSKSYPEWVDALGESETGWLNRFRNGSNTYYRQIVAINRDKNEIVLNVPTRHAITLPDIYENQDGVKFDPTPVVTKVEAHLEEIGIQDLSVGGSEAFPEVEPGGDPSDPIYDCRDLKQSYATNKNKCMALTAGATLFYLNHTNHSWLKNIKSYKPDENRLYHMPSLGIWIEMAAFNSVEEIDLGFPLHRGGGGNGYMIAVRGSDNLVKNSRFEDGRHNISISGIVGTGNVIHNVDSVASPGGDDFHGYLSPANLFDQLNLDRTHFVARNRGNGKGGQTSTESVFWNTTGVDTHIRTDQFRYGYYIGTTGQLDILNPHPNDDGFIPDMVEGEGMGQTLSPQSLYLDQFAKRMARGERVYLSSTITPPLPKPHPSSTSIVYQSRINGNDWVWNVNPDNDRVTAFDTVDRSKTVDLPVGREPVSIAIANNGEIWVTNKMDASLTIIQTRGEITAETLQLPIGSSPHGIVFDAGLSNLYVALESTGKILKIDQRTREILGSIEVGPSPRHITLNRKGDRLYVSRYITARQPGEDSASVRLQGGELVIINTEKEKKVSTIKIEPGTMPGSTRAGLGLPNYLGAAALSTNGTIAYIPSKIDYIEGGLQRSGEPLRYDNMVRAITSKVSIEEKQDLVLERITHANAGVASSAMFDREGKYLFVTLETSQKVAIIDLESNTEIAQFKVRSAPQGLALAPDGLTLYVYNYLSRKVTVHDLRQLYAEDKTDIKIAYSYKTVQNERLDPTVLRGKKLFYSADDPRLAQDGILSCAACHSGGGHDGRIWDLSNHGEGLRNTIALTGRGGLEGDRYNWGGRYDEIQDFEIWIREMAGGNGLIDDADYQPNRNPLLDDKAGLSSDLDALATYVNSLEEHGVSPARKPNGLASEGKKVFRALQCSSCHVGYAFTDSDSATLYDELGTISGTSDYAGDSVNLLGIDTPTLRGLWRSAPYLHDGSAPSIKDAILAHDGINFSELSDAQMDALVARLLMFDDQFGVKREDPQTSSRTLVHSSDSDVHFQLAGVDSEKGAVFSASGLPPGVSIDPQTGLISGQSSSAGTYRVRVTITRGAEAQRALNIADSATQQLNFTWIIGSGETAKPPATPTGQLRLDRYDLSGSGSILNEDVSFPYHPAQSQLLTRFEAPSDSAERLGQRMSGYLFPPVTGRYRFWIASDEEGELWLSSNAARGNRERIAFVPGWTDAQAWEVYPEQVSASIMLEAGRPYYIEAFAQDGGASENLAVAWQIPGGAREIISGAFLADAENQLLAEKEMVDRYSLPSIYLPFLIQAE